MTETQGWVALFLFAAAFADYCWMRDYTSGTWRWTFVCAALVVLGFTSVR